MSTLTEHDVYLIKEGTHTRLYDKLGAHTDDREAAGIRFAVWAPNAQAVSVIGDFNDWRPGANPLQVRLDGTGIWEGLVPEAGPDTRYKYSIESRYHGYRVSKADPFARFSETPPGTASRIWHSQYGWDDAQWMAERDTRQALDAPWSIYELHLGSWRRPGGEDAMPDYRQLAHELADYVETMGYTHVELLPVMEHPFYGSWGYQMVGFFAPTARYGTPDDFRYFVDHLHQRGIGVILDWVPSHFPNDEHGLHYFDGTFLYEHADPRQGFHPEWNSYIFNYGRNEVRAFLISSACFWLSEYHVDGLRVDAVASMLYLDYARKQGEWVPNEHGGKENLAAVSFLRQLNEAAYREAPGTHTIAEESTAWPMVSRPTHLGGLGFGMKWNMGWMHDTLQYFRTDPLYRKHHHGQLTFSIWYAFQENFVLSLSHDEVVHGKASLLAKMPGDDWQKFANLRLLFGYMFAHPGKKLMFMGDEFGQWHEWNHDTALEWHLLEHASHAGLQRWVSDLNRHYRQEPALHTRDFDADGFQWIDMQDWEQSVIAFARRSPSGPQDTIVVVCNCTPIRRENYQLGVPAAGSWREILNSDAAEFGGSGAGNFGMVESAPVAHHGHYQSLTLTLPPLGVLFLKRDAQQS